LLDEIVTVKNHNVNDEKLSLDMVIFVVISQVLLSTGFVWFAILEGCWNQSWQKSILIPSKLAQNNAARTD
jgi:hypothetical protein